MMMSVEALFVRDEDDVSGSYSFASIDTLLVPFFTTEQPRESLQVQIEY